MFMEFCSHRTRKASKPELLDPTEDVDTIPRTKRILKTMCVVQEMNFSTLFTGYIGNATSASEKT